MKLATAVIHIPYFRPNLFEFELNVLCICDARLYTVANERTHSRNMKALVLSELIVSPSGEYASPGISITNSYEAVATAFMRRFRLVPDEFYEFYPNRGQRLDQPIAPSNQEIFSRVIPGTWRQAFEGRKPAFNIDSWEPVTRGDFEHHIDGRFELPYCKTKFAYEEVELVWIDGIRWKEPLANNPRFNVLIDDKILKATSEEGTDHEQHKKRRPV